MIKEYNVSDVKVLNKANKLGNRAVKKKSEILELERVKVKHKKNHK
jgi:hypothetical protein